jgi:translation initiation factor 5A
MADEEHHDVHFESTDAGASKTFPQQAGTIRKSGHIVIKGRPCKVVDVSTSKTGKHGHAKCHFVAVDIFTSKKVEDLQPSSHNCDVPVVNRVEYQLIDISDDGCALVFYICIYLHMSCSIHIFTHVLFYTCLHMFYVHMY